jgi:hypothetical protein
MSRERPVRVSLDCAQANVEQHRRDEGTRQFPYDVRVVSHFDVPHSGIRFHVFLLVVELAVASSVVSFLMPIRLESSLFGEDSLPEIGACNSRNCSNEKAVFVCF